MTSTCRNQFGVHPCSTVPQCTKVAKPTPHPVEFGRAGFRVWTEDRYCCCSVSWSFSTRQDGTLPTSRCHHKMRPSSTSKILSSPCRVTVIVVLADHFCKAAIIEALASLVQSGDNINTKAAKPKAGIVEALASVSFTLEISPKHKMPNPKLNPTVLI